MQIRIFNSFDRLENTINEIGKLSEYSKFKSIELILPHSNLVTLDWAKKISNNYPRLNNIIIHGSLNNSYYPETAEYARIHQIKKHIKGNNDCHEFGKSYLSINESLFYESINYHNYYNKKVSIDTNGDIKNCNSLNQSFGNISKDSLEKVIESHDFQKLWLVKKDNTHGCKDCEFRYMCIDSRPVIGKINNLYKIDRSIDCGYNPYIGLWYDELGYEKLS